MKKLFIFIALVSPMFVSAASLSFSPSAKLANPGDVIVVPIRLTIAKGECVNAGTISLVYPADRVSVETVGRGESIFPFWLNEHIDNTAGSAEFSVGIPGGYCGQAAGDTGAVDVVAKIAFQYKSSESVTVAFASSTIFALADGTGTEAPLITTPLTIAKSGGATVRNEWLGEVAADHFPPEPFTPEIMRDITDEKSPFYLIFTTTDKQSGIDHYTVREEDPRIFGFHVGSSVRSQDIQAQSPYVLQDQALRSRIVVRAYDKAGNMIESILPPTNERPVFENSEWGVLVFIGAGIAAFVLIMLWSMKRLWWPKNLDEN